MKCKAAVLHALGQQWQIEEISITRRYTLDEINVGYQAVRNGDNIRGVIMYD